MSKERSQSRGRDVTSTGRGGAGNMARSESVSRGRVNRAVDGDERGRELSPAANAATKVTHVGRGGAGNVRSPSRDPVGTIRAELRAEQAIVDHHKQVEEHEPFSTGRGGAGNITRSPNHSVSPSRSPGGTAAAERARSRDPAPGRRYMSSGRGGYGNFHKAEHTEGENLVAEDAERAAIPHPEGALHSTGRGGAANVTALTEPKESHPTSEAPIPEGTHSSGKGGYGNIVHGQGEQPHSGGFLHNLKEKITGHH